MWAQTLAISGNATSISSGFYSSYLTSRSGVSSGLESAGRKRLSLLTSYDGQVGEREHELYANGPETVSSRDPKKLGHQAMCTSPYSAVSRAVDLVFSQLQPTKGTQFPWSTRPFSSSVKPDRIADAWWSWRENKRDVTRGVTANTGAVITRLVIPRIFFDCL